MAVETENKAPEDLNAAPGELETVRQFINSLDDDVEAFTAPEALHRWLYQRKLLDRRDPVSEADVEQAIELREALRDVIEGHTLGDVTPDASRRFDAASKRVPVRLRVDETGWVRLDPAEDGFLGALGQILAWAHASMEEGTWQRLKACANDTCRFAFYDHSKNRSGRWCDMSICGNRAKVTAFRARQAEASKPPRRSNRGA
jgi:predicted RNA-binding Zn ribbon-like protein